MASLVRSSTAFFTWNYYPYLDGLTYLLVLYVTYVRPIKPCTDVAAMSCLSERPFLHLSPHLCICSEETLSHSTAASRKHHTSDEGHGVEQGTLPSKKPMP